MLGQSVLDPTDTDLQKRVQGSFWVKLQRSEVADPESNYRLLAINILERAREKNYSASDMERACRRFELSQMYGDRIEVASFFDEEPEQLYPYSWTQRLYSEGKAKYTDFDGYLIAEGQPLRWRLHDGKRLEGLELIVWQGKTVDDKMNTPSPPKRNDRKLNQSEELSHANKLIIKLSKELAEAKFEIVELRGKVKVGAKVI